MKKLLFLLFFLPVVAFSQVDDATITTNINTNIRGKTYNPTLSANVFQQIVDNKFNPFSTTLNFGDTALAGERTILLKSSSASSSLTITGQGSASHFRSNFLDYSFILTDSPGISANEVFAIDRGVASTTRLSTYYADNLLLTTGIGNTAASGNISFITGDASGIGPDANSGNILFNTGAKLGAGVRGSISLFSSSPTFGGGEKVLFFGDGVTNPSTNPSTGFILYSDASNASHPTVRLPSGTIVDLTIGAGSSLSINSQTNDYTLVLADGTSTEIVMNKGTAINLTIPTHASIPIAVGASILVRNKGAGLLTIVLAGGVTSTPSSGSLTIPTGFSALLVQEFLNYWTIDNGSPALTSGDITTALGYTPWTTGGTTTITSNSTITTGSNNYNVNIAGAWTASTNNAYHWQFGGSFTGDATPGHVFNAYQFTPVLTTGAAQTTTAILVNATINDSFSSTTNIFKTQAAGSDRFSILYSGTVGIKFASGGPLNITGNGAGGFSLLSTNGGLAVTSAGGDFNLPGSLLTIRQSASNTFTLSIGTQLANKTTARYMGILTTQGDASVAYTPTSGVAGLFQIGVLAGSNAIFQPASGNSTYTTLQINDIINQNPAATGAITWFDINPTVTSIGSTAPEYGILQRRPSANSCFGCATPNSTLSVIGSMSFNYIAKSANYTLTGTDYLVEVTSGTNTQTLPTAVGIPGRKYVIVNSGAGTVTVNTTSSQTFVNVTATPTTLTMATVGTRVVESNGANWMLISSL